MSAPRWKTAIEKAIAVHKKETVFQLATVDSNGSPHVRSLIFREWFAGRPGLPILVTTTDIRTPKADQIRGNPKVELAWWIDGTKEQFRIAGKVSLISAPSSPRVSGGIQLAGGGPAMEALVASSIDWEAKRRDVFDSLSGHMKASWCRPVPGTPMPGNGGYDEAKKWVERLPNLGEATSDEEKKNLEEALGNFALLLVEPEEVDFVELGVVPNQRTKFTLEKEEWKEQICVP